jgi:hypothetical protein
MKSHNSYMPFVMCPIVPTPASYTGFVEIDGVAL